MQFNMTFNENKKVFETGLAEEVVKAEKDHRELTNRDASDQHPIKAITNLQTELDSLEVKPIDNSELYEILKGVEENGR